MGAPLAGILKNFWLNSFENSLQKPNDGRMKGEQNPGVEVDVH